jgi:metal-responsive CopG/Arc/MetJ family transcriptional regulator
MVSKRFNISLPTDLVEAIDKAATADFTSRSAYIREAVALKIRLDSHVREQQADKQSYFNVLKAAHFGKMTRRDINIYK